MKEVRRLGKPPKELGNTIGVSGSPDILELDDGSFAVIGVDMPRSSAKYRCLTPGVRQMSVLSAYRVTPY